MNCPVCGKEASVHIYRCTRCAVYAHDECWQKHIEQAYKKK